MFKTKASKDAPATTAAQSRLARTDEDTDDSTSPPNLKSDNCRLSAFPVPDRAGLKWKSSEKKVSLRSGDDRSVKAQTNALNPANAILEGDYDGAIRALSTGGKAAAACQAGDEGATLGKLHALTLLAVHPAPVKFIGTFLDKVAELQPDAIDQPDVYGRTALTSAVRRNDMELTGLLLEAGADPGALDRKRKSALTIATSKLNTKALALMHKHAAQNKLNAAEEKLIADTFEAGKPEELRMLAGISPAFAHGVMKRIVLALPAKLEKLDITNKKARSRGREQFEQLLPLLDNDHQYQLLLKLIRCNANVAGLMLDVSAPKLTPERLRMIRHAAAEAGNAAVHEWSSRNAPDLPDSGASAADLNAELLLALRAGNKMAARRLTESGGKIEDIVLPDNKVSLPAHLAELDSKMLAQHLKTTGKNIVLQDLLDARSADGLALLAQHFDLEQLETAGDEHESLAIMAVRLGCADLVSKLFELFPQLKKPWAGMRNLPSLLEAHHTPLKEAIRRDDQKMVKLLLDLGTLPTKVELQLAEYLNADIAAMIKTRYQRIPEEERA